MMTKPLVTIIVPSYNVEKYIDDCLLSIIGQDYTNTEVIIINDGSTDMTSVKIQEFEKKHSKVKYYSQNNIGLVKTNLRGITLSSGSLITFVDSDDWISPKYVSDLVDGFINEEISMVVNGFIRVNEDKYTNEFASSLNTGMYNAHDEKVLEELIYPVTSKIKSVREPRIAKMYKKEVLINLSELITTFANNGEDEIFTISTTLLSNKIFVDNSKFNYYYRIHSEGVSKKYIENNLNKRIDLFNNIQIVTQKLSNYNFRYQFSAYFSKLSISCAKNEFIPNDRLFLKQTYKSLIKSNHYHLISESSIRLFNSRIDKIIFISLRYKIYLILHFLWIYYKKRNRSKNL